MVELGYTDMFADMFDAIDAGPEPVETFYDGYVVNAVIDAVLPVGREPAVGAGRHRMARRHDAADRQARAPPRTG